MTDQECFALAVKGVVALLIVCVPCCTASGMYADYLKAQILMSGVSPLELGCATSHLSEESCRLLIRQEGADGK